MSARLIRESVLNTEKLFHAEKLSNNQTILKKLQSFKLNPEKPIKPENMKSMFSGFNIKRSSLRV
jgi:hypothetical protein